MPLCRKKPVIVEYQQFHQNVLPLPYQDENVVRFGCDCKEEYICELRHRFWVETLEGKLAISDGDYIMRGVLGEFYPCKPDAFALTYEILGEQPNALPRV